MVSGTLVAGGGPGLNKNWTSLRGLSGPRVRGKRIWAGERGCTPQGNENFSPFDGISGKPEAILVERDPKASLQVDRQVILILQQLNRAKENEIPQEGSLPRRRGRTKKSILRQIKLHQSRWGYQVGCRKTLGLPGDIAAFNFF